MQKKKILITSTMPDNANSNLSIRNYLVEGFRNEFNDIIIESVSIDSISAINIHGDYIFFVAVGSVLQDNANLVLLKKIAESLGAPLIFWLHDDPYEFDYAYKAEGLADLIFTNDKWALEHYQHPKVFHLPLAGSKSVHYKPISAEKKYDAFFAGVAYPNRLSFFKNIEKNVFGYDIKVLGDWWPEDMMYCKNQRVSAQEFANYASQSWFTLNLGRDFNLANKSYELVPSTPGPRTFETALSGSVQLYFADSLEVLDYFDLNQEILLFDSFRDINRYFEMIGDAPDELIDIAEKSQKRALLEHTYESRARNIFETVEKELL